MLGELGNWRAAAHWAIDVDDIDLAAELLLAAKVPMFLRTHDETMIALGTAIANGADRVSPERRRAALVESAFPLTIDTRWARHLAEAALAAQPDARDVIASQAHGVLATCGMLDGEPDEVEAHAREEIAIATQLLERGDLDLLTVVLATGRRLRGDVPPCRQASS